MIVQPTLILPSIKNGKKLAQPTLTIHGRCQIAVTEDFSPVLQAKLVGSYKMEPYLPMPGSNVARIEADIVTLCGRYMLDLSNAQFLGVVGTIYE